MIRLKSEKTKAMRVPNEIVDDVKALLSTHREKVKATKVQDRPEEYHRAVGLAKELGFEKLKAIDASEFYNMAIAYYPELNRWYGYQAFYDTMAEFTGEASHATWTGTQQ